MRKLRSHVKVGLASATASCCAMLLAAALDWLTGLPLHYGVFVAPVMWAALLYTGVVIGRLRGRQGMSITQDGSNTARSSGAAGRIARWGKRGRGASIKSALFLPHEGVRPAHFPDKRRRSYEAA